MVFVLPFVWTTAAATLSAAAVVATSYFMWTWQIPFYELHPQRIFDPQLRWQKPPPYYYSSDAAQNAMTTTTKTKSGRSGGSGFTFQATIRTLVQTEMMDHHFIHADIYAATFDIFYPTTWKGTVLAHIGNVRDLSLMKQQQQQQQQQDETSSCEVRMMPQQEQSQEKTEQQRIDNETTSSSSSTLTEQGPSSSTSSQQQPQQPLWTLQPRQSLQINDDLRLTLLPSLFHSLSTLSHLLWSFVKSGTITIPTTGVAHVRAGFVPGGGTSVAMTIRLICENVLHVFQQMTLVGNKCFIHGVTTGWSNLQVEQEKVQHYLQTQFIKTGRIV